ncbi:tripartite tricarboxylate transporter substrate binding protein [Pseudorhodoferax sp. Leaf274]|uniref:Bug family tripartite tricarboxylate transporter substrate binding protein n=1 Tax=Pseudorhodoferax sp. Leaf274 TaxID=1736318 RepID=UPI000703871F|nr:tripartite tricarboxylate transporter substrate binding protein [Pseudorhodoferax sp. Leaf274]KQP44205.1 LacI family transcriptional regulator [Pseudorhodoferax sp. Leaf274]
MQLRYLLPALAGATAMLAGTALADNAADFPTRPIRIVVPFSPGGGGDAVVRNIVDKLGERLGQQVVVDNRPGASGFIGAQLVAAAPPDGYTILMGFDGAMVVAPHLLKAPFDTLADFAPITKLNDATLVLAAHPSVGAKTLPELVALSKARPGGLQFGSSGAGTTTHLAGELLALRTGMRLTHVPYKGGGQAVTDVVGGQIPLIFTVLPTIAPFVSTGKLEAVVVAGATRSRVLPDVPTAAESGAPGYAVASWYGLFAPAKTPRAIVEKLQREVAAVLALPEIREKYAKGGFEPVGNTPAEFAAQVKADLARWGQVVKEANIRLD